MDKRRTPALLLSISVFFLMVGGLFYVHYALQRQPVMAEAEMVPASPIPTYPGLN